MKKILLLLLLATFGIQAQTLQNPTYGKLKLKANIQSTTATKVNVQENDGTINTKPLSELANYLEFASAVNLPVTGEQGKLYLTKDNNRLYRFNGTIYQELTTDISGKEDIGNKQNSLAVDGTNTKYPTVTAVNTGLSLKANLASPALTGTPTAPTATAGTNTTQIATTAFVTGGIATADSGNVKTTGAQTIVGRKTFNTVSTDRAIQINNSSTGEGISILNSAAGFGQNVFNTSTGEGVRIGNTSIGTGLFVENQSGGTGIVSRGTTASTGYIFSGRLESSNTFTVDKFGATTATSFINSTAPATNILLAGGSDIAQNTAFNKNFGTTAGTVVEGNYPPAKDGTGATGTWGINITGSSYNSTLWNGYDISVAPTDATPSGILGFYSSGVTFQRSSATALSSFLGLGTNAYSSTAFLPLSGGTLSGIVTFNQNASFNANALFNGDLFTDNVKPNTGNTLTLLGGGANNLQVNGVATFSSTVTATSYTATSLPVFENNASASSLAVGQFYRTSTGVLMVKF